MVRIGDVRTIECYRIDGSSKSHGNNNSNNNNILFHQTIDITKYILQHFNTDRSPPKPMATQEERVQLGIIICWSFKSIDSGLTEVP